MSPLTTRNRHPAVFSFWFHRLFRALPIQSGRGFYGVCMIHPQHLRDYVILPVLHKMEMYSEAAVQLLLMTAAHESHLGHYLAQHPAGPAAGIYQCEPATAQDILKRYLVRRRDLELRFESAFQLINTGELDWAEVPIGGIKLKLVSDLRFATAVCRLHYWMVPEALPAADDVRGLARYYKAHYNTNQGKATVDKVVEDYRRFVVDPLGL